MEEQPREKEDRFTVDITTEPYKKLASYAARITALLDDPALKNRQDVTGCLDELIGSIYSLIHAAREEFEDRTNKPKAYGPILTRAQDLSKGEVRTAGKWMAGFHVNSSTYRTAAVHNRLLKIITGVNTDKIKELDDEAGAKYKQWAGGQQWKRDQLKKVSEEANHLKHTDEGIFSKRGLTYHRGLEPTRQEEREGVSDGGNAGNPAESPAKDESLQ